MKPILPLFAIAMLMSAPAWSQENAGTPIPQAEEGEEAVSAAAMALAKEMHEIWPIRTRIESAIDSVAQNFPPEKQAEAKAIIRRNIQFDQVEEESIRAMASTFTEEELRAMVDFYGSETGRGISSKTQDYEAAMVPVITKMMDKAMLDLKTGMAQ